MELVKIVRCKDCKYKPINMGKYGVGRDLYFPTEYKCPFECDDPYHSQMPDDEFYCANGEEK